MLFASPFLAAKAAAMILASTNLVCKVTEAPAVTVKVLTDEIQYDFSKTAIVLSAIKTSTVSPYPKNTDTVTGGLRQDAPTISSQMGWRVGTAPGLGQACMTFRSIDVVIQLRPHIYVAQEFNYSPCSAAILGHEKKHVSVDRDVMNKYAGSVGLAVQAALNKVGALGPFKPADQALVEQQAEAYIRDTIGLYKDALHREMRARQAEVDTLAEYQRVGAYCKQTKLKR